MRKTLLVAVVLFGAACASNSSSPASGSSPDVAAYQQLTADLSTQVASYRQTSAAATDVAQCTAAQDLYDSQVRPMVERLSQLSSQTDDFIKSSGDLMDSDMLCGSTVMQNELDNHRAVACAGSMAANHAEAIRHCNAMDDFLNRLGQRVTQVVAMMGGCCGSADGGYGSTGEGEHPWMMGSRPMPMCWFADGGPVADGGPRMMEGSDATSVCWSADGGAGTDGGPPWMTDGGPMPGCSFSDGGYVTDAGYWTDGGWMTDGGNGLDGGPMTGGGMH
jgi:hypothetical protein